MKILHASSSDTEEIVKLLKESLGEESTPKSSTYWHWKHVANPFGISPVLLAEDDGKLAGVRAFMRWNWNYGAGTCKAVRAVDTATHPQQQGKGIFKKLTLQLVDECKEEGVNFVFNTPNTQSRPGYLKMGWEEAGKIPVGLRLNVALPLPGKTLASQDNSMQHLPALCAAYNRSQEEQMMYFTPKTPEYLEWRYQNNPVLNYTIITVPECYIACYVRKRKSLTELRIAECIIAPSTPNAGRIANRLVSQVADKVRAQIISYSKCVDESIGSLISRVGMIGPNLTLRRLSSTDDQWKALQRLENWNFVLGDMELF